MTNAEAIGILAIVVETANGRCFITDEAISEAYGMAIKALKAQESNQLATNLQPCKQDAYDTISRAAAIDAVRELYIQYPKINNDIVYDTAIDQAHDTLVNLPSAQPNLPIKEKCAFCPHCDNCDVNDDLSIQPCVDTISRQAVIDTVRKTILGFFSSEDGAMTDTEKTLMSVNKAIRNALRAQENGQLSNNSTKVDSDSGDLISRQAAIDACIRVREYRAYDEIEEIKALPSAQPKIVRCKECVNSDENYHCDYMTTWNYGDCFCSYGKRRTDG